MYDLKAEMLEKVLPKSTTWRTALILSQAGTQYAEYSRTKPRGKDPRLDFPGFDLDKIAQDIRAYLGGEVRGVRSQGEEYNEVLGHLWYLTTKRSFPKGDQIVTYRADASTEARKVFTLGKLGDDLHLALGDVGGHYPFLLSQHSKSYWSAILVLGAIQAGQALTLDEISTFTGMSGRQIQAGVRQLAEGFTATATNGETRLYKGVLVKRNDKYRLSSELVFANDNGADLDGLELKDPPKKRRSPAPPPRPPSIPVRSAREPAPVLPMRFEETSKVPVPGETAKVTFTVEGDLASLIISEAHTRGLTPNEFFGSLMAVRLTEVQALITSLAQQRFEKSRALFEEAKARLEAEHEEKLTALRKQLGV